MRAAADFWGFFEEIATFWGFVAPLWGNLGIRLLIRQSKIGLYYEPKFHLRGRAGTYEVLPKRSFSRRYSFLNPKS